jgi:hypothetical protein
MRQRRGKTGSIKIGLTAYPFQEFLWKHFIICEVKDNQW